MLASRISISFSSLHSSVWMSSPSLGISWSSSTFRTSRRDCLSRIRILGDCAASRPAATVTCGAVHAASSSLRMTGRSPISGDLIAQRPAPSFSNIHGFAIVVSVKTRGRAVVPKGST